MLADIFGALVYNPLYNGLIFLIGVVPFADVGIAVVLLTLIVKVILFPLSIKAVRTQMAVREIDKPLKEIKEKYKEDKVKQAEETMALYKEKGINPFSVVLVLLIQIPIVLGLYWVFFRGGLPAINTDILYAFVQAPDLVNMSFLGLVDVNSKSVILALLVGVSQYIQAKLTLPKQEPRPENPTMKDDFARSFQMQIRYVFPILIAVIAYVISVAVALYFLTSNITSIAQEVYVRRFVKKDNGIEPKNS